MGSIRLLTQDPQRSNTLTMWHVYLSSMITLVELQQLHKFIRSGPCAGMRIVTQVSHASHLNAIRHDASLFPPLGSDLESLHVNGYFIQVET